MQAVNLLPAYARPGSRLSTVGKDLSPKKALTVGGVAAGVAAVALGGLYAYEHSVVNGKRNDLATAQARLTAVEAQAAPLRAVQAKVTAERSAVTTVDHVRIPWETVLGGLSRVLPSQVYLTSLQATTPTPAASLASAASTPGAPAPVPAPAPSTTSFSVNGVASSQTRVALVLDRLALMPWLTDVSLISSARGTSGQSGKGGGDQFSIQATFGPAGGSK